MSGARVKTAILISGSGTNLQAFIDRSKGSDAVLDIGLVISNRADAFGLERAARAGIPAACIDHRDYPTREAFDRAIAARIDEYAPGLIVLAGFMRILSPWFVSHFEGRILNIHPALLPKYPGLDTHRRALAAGDDWHGSTVHFVTEELDGGPRVAQGRLRIERGEDPEGLSARVQAIEHAIYPAAAEWVASGEIRFADGHALRNGEPMPEPVVVDF